MIHGRPRYVEDTGSVPPDAPLVEIGAPFWLRTTDMDYCIQFETISVDKQIYHAGIRGNRPFMEYLMTGNIRVIEVRYREVFVDTSGIVDGTPQLPPGGTDG